MHGIDGRTFTYGWKFKLDKEFQGSGDFCHLHQIKLVGTGEGAKIPCLTYTARKDRLEVISKDVGKLAAINLDLIRGEWLKVREIITYGKEGTLAITITRLGDHLELINFKGVVPLSCEGSVIRPKWGIYRSLKRPELLRDERVLFSDFFISQGINLE